MSCEFRSAGRCAIHAVVFQCVPSVSWKNGGTSCIMLICRNSINLVAWFDGEMGVMGTNWVCDDNCGLELSLLAVGG